MPEPKLPSKESAPKAAPKPNVTHVVQFASTIAAAHAATKGIDKLSASALSSIVETALALEALVRQHTTTTPSAS